MADVVENRGPQLATIDYTFVILAFITILMRCAVRVFIVRSFGVDDWLMAFAAVTFMLYCAFSISGVQHGTGQHEAALPAANVATARMYWWICYLMYCMTMILSKLSIGYLLLRVAVQRIHGWIIYGAMVITVVTCTAFFFVTVFQCKPVSFFWNKSQDGTCVSMDVIIGLAYLYSTCSVITDFTFALLPAWIIYGLQLKRRTKIALVPLMAMGCVASAAVIVRFAYLSRFRDPDFLWATVDIAIWSTVEQGLAVTAGSLATLRPLLRLIGHRLGLTTGPTNKGNSTYGNLGGSHTGHLSSRRNGSRAAGAILTKNSLRDNLDASSSSPKFSTSYEVQCEAKSKNDAEVISLSNVIAHSKTYEVSSEYVNQPPASPQKSWRISSSRVDQEKEKGRSQSSESTERLRTAFTNDSIYGPSASPV